MKRSTFGAWQLCFAAMLAATQIACGAGQSAPTARRVVVAAPKGDTNTSGPNGEPSTACRTACSVVQSPEERLASCEIARAAVSFAELFPDPTFLVCKLERK